MSTLMCQDPNPSEHESLHGCVCYPAESSQVWVREVGNVGLCEVDEGGGVEEVADDVGHGSNDGGLEAVCWDGIVDLLHGICWELEFVTVEIEMVVRHVLGGRLVGDLR